MNTARIINKAGPRIVREEERDMKWEYSVIQLNVPMFSELEVLNSLGDNCWELVNVIQSDPGQTTAYFKRPKR